LGYSVLRALRQGQKDLARSLFDESLTAYRELHHKTGVADCLIGFAGLAHVSGATETAARLLGGADAILNSCNGGQDPADWAERDSDVVSIRYHLGAPTFTRLYAEGLVMSLEQLALVARQI